MPRVGLPQASIEYSEGELDRLTPNRPPVLFVHGALVDARLWSSVAEHLAAQGFRCILPGGRSVPHTTPVNDRAVLSPRMLPELIHRFVVDLDLTDVTLVGERHRGGLCQFDRCPSRPDRPIGAHQLRRVRSLPAVPVQRDLRPDALGCIRSRSGLADGVTALRHSPAGYGLLITKPDPELPSSENHPRAPTRRSPVISRRSPARSEEPTSAPRLPRLHDSPSR